MSPMSSKAVWTTSGLCRVRIEISVGSTLQRAALVALLRAVILTPLTFLFVVFLLTVSAPIWPDPFIICFLLPPLLKSQSKRQRLARPKQDAFSRHLLVPPLALYQNSSSPLFSTLHCRSLQQWIVTLVSGRSLVLRGEIRRLFPRLMFLVQVRQMKLFVSSVRNVRVFSARVRWGLLHIFWIITPCLASTELLMMRLLQW